MSARAPSELDLSVVSGAHFARSIRLPLLDLVIQTEVSFTSLVREVGRSAVLWSPLRSGA